jgi:hypothetical protein
MDAVASGGLSVWERLEIEMIKQMDAVGRGVQARGEGGEREGRGCGARESKGEQGRAREDVVRMASDERAVYWGPSISGEWEMR